MPLITTRRRLTPLAVANTASAYTAGVAVGGLLSFGGQFPGGGGLLRQVRVVDPDNIKLPLNIVIFDTLPATTPTNLVAYAPTAQDLQGVAAIVPVLATDYVSFGSRAVAVKALAAPLAYTVANGALWVAVIAAGTGTLVTVGGQQIMLCYDVD